MTMTIERHRGARRCLALAVWIGLAWVGSASEAPAATPPCSDGKVTVGGGCCWPSQRLEAGLCTGLPRCPSGTLVSKGECVTRAAYAESLGQTCAKLEVGFDSAAAPEDPSRRACDELAGMLGDAEPRWMKACDAGDAAACLLFGAARQGYRTVSSRVELWVARCRANNCDGHRQSAERLGFSGTKRDPVATRRAFEKACRGGISAACVELAQLGAEKSEPREACLARGDVRACSEAAYRIAAVGRVSDAELVKRAEEILRGACDAGQGLACNNLGFLNERKLAGAKTVAAAMALYQRACVAGSALGCASLVMAALRTPALVRTIGWGDAVKVLDAACDEASEPAREVCLAHGFALQRGFGTKADVRRGQGLVGRLCKAGFSDACER